MEDADDGADRDAPTGNRLQSTARKERPNKGKPKGSAEAQEPAAADDDVCTEEPYSEEMVEEAAALEVEEEKAKAGGGWSAEKVGGEEAGGTAELGEKGGCCGGPLRGGTEARPRGEAKMAGKVQYQVSHSMA
ncbi:DNA (cytosine-5)-methyltransferase 1-like [Miscanthus floridulus]|uniref:DNA (cytosine-5)-methyltransferase 1-like n=1 Tax=Miscanthus floridulus TaxID=154761 RepID=UPI00345A40B4